MTSLFKPIKLYVIQEFYYMSNGETFAILNIILPVQNFMEIGS